MKNALHLVDRTVRLLCLAAGAAALALATPVTAHAAAPINGLQPVSATDSGPTPSSQLVQLTLALKVDPARTAALQQLLPALIDPASPNYHRWLTPQAFAASYGATTTQLAAATAWAQAQGLAVTAISAGATQMQVSGTVAQIQASLGVSLHSYTTPTGVSYYAATAPLALGDSLAAMFTTVSGLDTIPLARPATLTPVSGSAQVTSTLADALSALLLAVDQNTSPVLTFDSSFCSASLTQAQIDQFTTIIQQAAAQGITLVATSGCGAQGTGSFPAALAEVTGVLPAGSTAANTLALATRPAWQVAQGLPADSLRYEPDLTATSLTAFAQTIATLVQQTGSRQGVVTANLYKLAAIPGLYTQPDNAAAGTWETATGLGAVNLDTLTKVYPRGSGASFATFAATSYSPIHGQPTTFSSSVTSGTGGGTPTGTVSFNTSTGVTLGTVNLVNGYASFTINTMAGGTYIINAAYSGDGTYGAATSPTAQILIQPEPSALTATVSGAAVIGSNVNVIVTDTATSGVGQPSGPVSVSLPTTGSTYSATLAGTTANAAAATVSFPAPAVGTITLSINCTTSASFSCYNPFTTTATIVKATPTLTISYSPNPPVPGGTITLNATVTGVGTAPSPTGNVVFSDNGTVLNAGALANGSTTTTGIVPNTQTHTITAQYAGDPNYNTVSTSAGQTTAGPIATTLALTSSTATVVSGQSIVFTATLTPASNGAASPTGSVQFYDGTTLIGTASLNGNIASLNYNGLSATANHSISAIYAGDANYSGSTSNAVAVAKGVTPIATTTALTYTTTAASVGSTIFTATVTPASTGSASPTGSVQFFDGATQIGTATLASNTATLTIATPSTSVSHSITAVYAGDTLYAASASPSVVIPKASSLSATTTTLTASPTTGPQGTAFTFTATVGPTVNNTAPTGTVQFVSGGTILCTSTLSAAAIATCIPTSTLTVGTTSVTAVYLGDTNYATSTSGAATITVTTNTAVNSTLIASISPAVSVLPGATATITAILNAPVGLVPAGSITATITGVAGAVYTTTLPGTANTNTLTVTIPVITPSVAGTYSVVVACNGTNFACLPVTLSLVSSTTAKIGSATVLTSSALTAAYGTSITLTATVTGASGSSTPTGSVVFYNGTLAVATGTLTSTGVATATIPITATTNSFTAVYAGDTTFSGSTSTALVITSAATPSGLTLYSNTTNSLAGYDIVLTVQIVGSQATGSSAVASTPTGKVYFYDTFKGVTTLLGTAAVTSSGGNLATAGFATTGLTLGTHLLYAVYSGDATYATQTSSTITLSETDYSVTPSYPPSLTLLQGSTGTVFYLVNFLGGLNGSVNLSCVPPTGTGVTCTFNPSQVSTGGGPTTLTITTTAPKAELAYPILWQTTGSIVCAGLLGLFLPRRRSLSGLLLAAFALAIMSNLGCGQTTLIATPGAGQTSGTPLGTISLTINSSGTDGTSIINHTYSYLVNIQ